VYSVTFKHYHSQYATVSKINLDYFINRPDSSKEFFIIAANSLRGAGLMDSLSQVPLEPTHSMGFIFSSDPDGESSSYTCYEAEGSHVSGLFDGTGDTISHSDVNQN